MIAGFPNPSSSVFQGTAAERRRNTSKDGEDFNLKAKAGFWP
jgi:hypothetical protein